MHLEKPNPFPALMGEPEFAPQKSLRSETNPAFAGNAFRLIQFTPPGSSTSVQFGVNLTSAAPGSTQALLMAVNEIKAVHRQLVANRHDASEVLYCATGAACRFPGVCERITGLGF